MDQVNIQDFGSTAEEITLEISMVGIYQEKSRVIKLVNASLYDALQSRASDIHLENIRNGLVVNYRMMVFYTPSYAATVGRRRSR